MSLPPLCELSIVAIGTGGNAPKQARCEKKVGSTAESRSTAIVQPLGCDGVPDVVFENLLNVIADDVDVCKAVKNYIVAISLDTSIQSVAKTNGDSTLWFELLRRLGWLDLFLSNKTLSDPITPGEFADLLKTWNEETGITWRKYFDLLCFLRRAKQEMIFNARTKTLDHLLFQVDDRYRHSRYRLHDMMQIVATAKSDSLFKELRTEDGGPFYALEDRQWVNVQRMALTLYNVLPNADNLEHLNDIRPWIPLVDNLSLAALQDYMTNFYNYVLTIHTEGVSLRRGLIVNGDEVFIKHMLSVSLGNYKYISEDYVTQAHSDMASANAFVISLIPREFRMTETFIVNAFKNDQVKLLVPGGVNQLEGLGIDSDELFSRVMDVVGTTRRLDFLEDMKGDWDQWLDDHIDILMKKEFSEMKTVIEANPNTIVFFAYEAFLDVNADDLVYTLGTIFTTTNHTNHVAEEALIHMLKLIDDLYDKDKFDSSQFLALTYKAIETKDENILDHLLDEYWGFNITELAKAVTEQGEWENFLMLLVESFSLEEVVPAMFKAAKKKKVDKEIVKNVIRESQIFVTAYSEWTGWFVEYKYIIDAQRHGFIERDEFIDLIAKALRTGDPHYDKDFRELAFRPHFFEPDELRLLAAAQTRDDRITPEEQSTFFATQAAAGGSHTVVEYDSDSDAPQEMDEDDYYL